MLLGSHSGEYYWQVQGIPLWRWNGLTLYNENRKGERVSLYWNWAPAHVLIKPLRTEFVRENMNIHVYIYIYIYTCISFLFIEAVQIVENFYQYMQVYPLLVGAYHRRWWPGDARSHNIGIQGSALDLSEYIGTRTQESRKSRQLKEHSQGIVFKLSDDCCDLIVPGTTIIMNQNMSRYQITKKVFIFLNFILLWAKRRKDCVVWS